MRMILIRDEEAQVAEILVDALEEAGFEPEEAIPGLIMAAKLIAEVTSDPEQALDEAANILADGPTAAEAFQ